MVVGKISLKYFVDRERELAELKKNTKALLKGDSKNHIIVSPRRMGKTSLIRKHIEEVNSQDRLKKVIPLEVNCQLFLDWSDLADRLIDTALANYRRKSKDKLVIKRVTEFASERLSKALGKISEIEGALGAATGDYLKLRLAMREERVRPRRLIEKALWSLEEFALKKGVFFEVFLDEFQQVKKFKDFDVVLGVMRDAFQSQGRVSYTLSGSSVSIMQEIYTRESSPFFKQLSTISLGFLNKKDIIEYLNLRGVAYDDGGVKELLRASKGIPDYMVKIVDAAGRITVKGVRESFDEIILLESKTYATIYESLSLTQQKVLVSIARGRAKYSEVQRDVPQAGLGAVLNYMVVSGLLIKPRQGVYDIFDVGFKRYIQLVDDGLA